ncbi:MAG TPA: thiolase domain-containing protein [Polyangiaceae bacterium]|jgi:acetyl-CoA acetyltransferase
MRDVAVVSFARSVQPVFDLDEVEMLAPCIAEALSTAGLGRKDVGFTVSGSSDYLGGRPFSFVTTLDAVGAWPPIRESHVEMDGAWALYEAWVALQHGDIDVALVYAFGRSTQGDLAEILGAQLDPYTLSPLGIDATSLAALQARAMLDAGRCSERDMAAVAARARGGDRDALLKTPYVAAPLRAHDCAPPADGVAAVVLVAGDRARACCGRPAWIRGIDHRIEPHALGARDLTVSSSVALAAKKAGVGKGRVDVAELDAPYSHQEILVRQAMGLGDSVRVNPSGGPLAGWPYIVSGLVRIGEASRRVHTGEASRAVAHATSGPCLQQNLVCVLEAE